MTVSTARGATTQNAVLKRVALLAAIVTAAAFVLTSGADAQRDSLWDGPQVVAASTGPTDVVTGTVIDIAYVESTHSIHTVATIAVSDRHVGDAPDEIRVEIAGGVFPDGSRLLVSHQPTFDLASTVRLDLVPATTQEQADLGDGVYSILGSERGLTLLSNPRRAANASSDYTYLDNEHQGSFPVSFSLVQGVFPALETELVDGAIEWDTQTCSAIEFTYDGQLSNDPFNVDGVNMIGPSTLVTLDPDTLAAAYRLVDPMGEMIEWDIVFNTPSVPFSIGGVVPGTYDWRTIQRHEIGHILGLDHVETGNSEFAEVMYPFFDPETIKLLGTGDRTGVTLLYPAHPFTDITPLAYYERPVAWLAESGITTGTTPTTYSPSNQVTRAQMATFLYRLAGSPAVSGTTPFTDVPATGQYFSTPVLWLLQSGITTGTSATTFSPHDPVTRGQMATFLHRFEGSPPVSGSHPFTDVEAGLFYSIPINWLYQQGITTGLTPTLFGPADPVSRAQMATFLHRFEGEPVTC